MRVNTGKTASASTLALPLAQRRDTLAKAAHIVGGVIRQAMTTLRFRICRSRPSSIPVTAFDIS
jgi:hypothetical protein